MLEKKYIILIFFPPNIFPSDLSRERGGQINLTILHIFSLLTDFHKLFRNINFISGTVNEWIVRDVEWCNIWLSDCVECKLHTATTAVLGWATLGYWAGPTGVTKQTNKDTLHTLHIALQLQVRQNNLWGTRYIISPKDMHFYLTRGYV